MLISEFFFVGRFFCSLVSIFFSGFMSVLVVCCLFILSVCLVCSGGNACLFWRWLEGKFKGGWFVAVVGSDPENWLKGNRESREGSRTTYLVFWQVWLVLSRLWGLGHLDEARAGGMVCGIYKSHGWRVGDLQLVLWFRANGKSENWVWGNRDCG